MRYFEIPKRHDGSTDRLVPAIQEFLANHEALGWTVFPPKFHPSIQLEYLHPDAWLDHEFFVVVVDTESEATLLPLRMLIMDYGFLIVDCGFQFEDDDDDDYVLEYNADQYAKIEKSRKLAMIRHFLVEELELASHPTTPGYDFKKKEWYPHVSYVEAAKQMLTMLVEAEATEFPPVE